MDTPASAHMPLFLALLPPVPASGPAITQCTRETVEAGLRALGLPHDRAVVDRALGARPSITVDALVQHMTRPAPDGLSLSRCKAYHLRRTLERAKPPAPVVLARTVDSVVVRVFPFPAEDHVPVDCIRVRVQVGEEAVEEEVRPRNGAAAFSGPVEHVVRRPAGSALAVTSRCCVLGDDALSNTFAWSDAVRTRTLQLPAAPRAAVVESCAPASATLRLENAGRTSDPQAVRLELRCNDGAVQAVPLPSADAVEVVHVLRGLHEGTRYSVQYRCVVADDTLNPDIPWSAPVDFQTPTLAEVKIAELRRELVCCAPVWHLTLCATVGLVVAGWGGGYGVLNDQRCPVTTPCGLHASLHPQASGGRLTWLVVALVVLLAAVAFGGFRHQGEQLVQLDGWLCFGLRERVLVCVVCAGRREDDCSGGPGAVEAPGAVSATPS